MVEMRQIHFLGSWRSKEMDQGRLGCLDGKIRIFWVRLEIWIFVERSKRLDFSDFLARRLDFWGFNP
jgi:hypothetical protein